MQGINTGLARAPDAKAPNDNSNQGVYKGVFVGSSGIVYININNNNTVSAFIIIDNITYNFTTAQTVQPGQATSISFVSGSNSFTFSVGASGANPAVTNLIINGHPNAAALIVKEISTALVKCLIPGNVFHHKQPLH